MEVDLNVNGEGVQDYLTICYNTQGGVIYDHSFSVLGMIYINGRNDNSIRYDILIGSDNTYNELIAYLIMKEINKKIGTDVSLRNVKKVLFKFSPTNLVYKLNGDSFDLHPLEQDESDENYKFIHQDESAPQNNMHLSVFYNNSFAEMKDQVTGAKKCKVYCSSVKDDTIYYKATAGDETPYDVILAYLIIRKINGELDRGIFSTRASRIVFDFNTPLEFQINERGYFWIVNPPVDSGEFESGSKKK